MEMRDELEKWAQITDRILKDIEPEKPVKKQAQTSFFTDSPMDGYESEQDEQGDPDWLEIYHRATEVDFTEGDNLITEDDDPNTPDDEDSGSDKRDGFGHLVRGDKQLTKGDITYNQNPVSKFSVGPDGGKEAGPIRVTPNWGGENAPGLEEIDELKHQILAMEREAGKADVMNDKSKRNSLRKQLETLRVKVSDLSEKIQPQVDTDVT
jgi:hypothetical protein